MFLDTVRLRQGYGGTRMRRIIRSTGMCRGGLYARLTTFFFCVPAPPRGKSLRVAVELDEGKATRSAAILRSSARNRMPQTNSIMCSSRT